MITDEEINRILDEKDITFVINAVEDLGYTQETHVVPHAYTTAYTQSHYVDFLVENYHYNYNQMVIFYKRDRQYAEHQNIWSVVIVVDTPDGNLLIDQLKRYFKMKAFL